MARFFDYILIISLLCQSVLCNTLTDCDCEADKSITLKTIDDAALDRINNRLEKIDARNEVLYYRLEILGERFQEHEKLLRELNQKACQAHVSDDIKTQTVDENISQQSPKSDKYPRSCFEATNHQSGLYTIQIDSYSNKEFLVYCEHDIQGGGWTVIQRRKDGNTDFYRDWASYKFGFGSLNGEFFIGLDNLHALTKDVVQELLIVMTDFNYDTKYAKYDAFAIGDEDEGYALKVLGSYSGDAGDSLSQHKGFKFTTKDKKNDNHINNCAVQFKGAWWYDKCHVSNLNGLYLRGSYDHSLFAQGVVWKTWHDYNYSLKTVQMLIRPKKA